MVESSFTAKSAVKSFDDIGPEFNFTVKVREANLLIDIEYQPLQGLFHFEVFFKKMPV